MDRAVVKRQSCYVGFWGREFDAVFHPTELHEPHIDVFRFPPITPKWFLKRWMVPAYRQYVYMTGGMSDAPMPVPASCGHDVTRAELTAYSNKIYKNESGDADMVAWWLHFLASAPFRPSQEKVFYAVGHTFSAGEPIMPGSQMTGFLFSVTPSVAMRSLCCCTPHAQVVLHVVPISDGERQMAKDNPRGLIDYFEEHGIEPFFDLERTPYV